MFEAENYSRNYLSLNYTEYPNQKIISRKNIRKLTLLHIKELE